MTSPVSARPNISEEPIYPGKCQSTVGENFIPKIKDFKDPNMRMGQPAAFDSGQLPQSRMTMADSNILPKNYMTKHCMPTMYKLY